MVTTMRSRKSYFELQNLETFEERFEYLKLPGIVSHSTFGGHRYLNQAFYRSPEWRKARDYVILRDKGCDLGIDGLEIPDGERLVVHHMNPITPEDIENRSESLFDPNNLICVSDTTHKMIHYGDIDGVPDREPVVRRPNDTVPWKS